MASPVVLIHGAWQGSWAWDALLPRLEGAGLACHAVDLPSEAASLDAYVAHMAGVVAGLAGPVTLLAHSGGGVTASQVAEAMPERIARIVYLAGMMLPDGTSFAEVVASVLPDHPGAAGIWPHLSWSADRAVSRVPEAAALEVLYHDCPPELARAAAARLRPQPERGRNVRPRLTAERFGRVPRTYVEALRDRSVVPAVQRRMQALVPGADRLTIDTGHAPQLAAPDRLAALLLPVLAG